MQDTPESKWEDEYMKKFDRTTLDNKYGIVFGTNILVYIKTGNGGNIYGYENKYQKIANRINDELGYAVLVAANPVEEQCNLQSEMGNVFDTFGIYNTFDDIIYIGFSDGANIGAQQGYLIPEIKRMLLINGPLMINFHKTKRGICAFENEKIEMVYGKQDPSYKYVELLDSIDSRILLVNTLENIDHNFTNALPEFEQLIFGFVNEFQRK